MTIISQILAALLVGGCYYMLAVIMTVYDGLLSLIFQPIVGAILTGIVIAVLLLVGLPIRLVKSINEWWRAHWWIGFIIGSVAFLMMLLSWIPRFQVKVYDPELQMEVSSFHPVLAIGGWVLTIFAVLHFYPPLTLLKRMKYKGGLTNR